MTVPDELAALTQWVVWKLESRKGKTTKVPHRAKDGRRASTTDPSDWATLDEAVEAVDSLGMDGIGFVFSADDPYCGVDLDHCVDEAGEIHPEAMKLVEKLGTYAEVSVSGTGVHCIFRGNAVGRNRTSDTPWGGNLEVYDSGRYFTFSGRSLNGSEIKEATLEIQADGQPDQRIIDKCRRNSKGFAELYDEGDFSDYLGDDGQPDRSRADLALSNMIAARTSDVDQVERIMRASAMVREKWDHPDTGSTWLRRRCIEPAIRDSKKAGKSSQFSGDFEEDVKTRMYQLEVIEEARRRHKAKDVPEDLGLPPGMWSLEDELALPELEVVHRIGDLQPIGGNVLLVAAYKSGKTTLTLNLLRSLADGVPFLGKFPIEPFEGNICVVNYEETPAQWRRHARMVGIENTTRIFPLHRRGQPILPIWEPRAQARLVQWMIEREITYWIMDPTVVAWQGLVDNENDNALVAAFTTALDQVKEQAGIGELMLTHHEGRLESGRGRGATRLEDWMDAGWYLSRDDATSQRTIWAKGRDVELERTALNWREDKWQLLAGESLTEHEKKEQIKEAKDAKGATIELLGEHGPLSLTRIAEGLKAIGVGMKHDSLRARLFHWCGSADNPMRYKSKRKGGKEWLLFYLEGQDLPADWLDE